MPRLNLKVGLAGLCDRASKPLGSNSSAAMLASAVAGESLVEGAAGGPATRIAACRASPRPIAAHRRCPARPRGGGPPLEPDSWRCRCGGRPQAPPWSAGRRDQPGSGVGAIHPAWLCQRRRRRRRAGAAGTAALPDPPSPPLPCSPAGAPRRSGRAAACRGRAPPGRRAPRHGRGCRHRGAAAGGHRPHQRRRHARDDHWRRRLLRLGHRAAPVGCARCAAGAGPGRGWRGRGRCPVPGALALALQHGSSPA